MDETRRLTVLIAEYSDTAPAGVSGMAALSSQHAKAISGMLARRRGTIREMTGVRVIASFEQPVDAAPAALELLDLLRQEQTGIDARRGLTGRIGVAQGEVMIVDQAIRGAIIQKLRRAITELPMNTAGVDESMLDLLPQGTKVSERPRTGRPGADSASSLGLHVIRAGGEWMPDTQVAAPTMSSEADVFTEMDLIVRGERTTLGHGQCPWLIGRDESCHTRLTGHLASRVHGRIEHEGGRFYYVDESANGSYVLTSSGNEILVHKERFMLMGRGAISAGAPIAEQRGEVVRFDCRAQRLRMMDEGETGSTGRL